MIVNSANQVNSKNEIKENVEKIIVKDNEYNDLELNSLSYEEALQIDNRTYFEYYNSLLRMNHLFIFTFITNKDYNSRIIKILLFFFFFSVFFTINVLFFNDNTMHKIYEDKGEFNFIYQIPQIIYSALISAVINSIIKILALSQKTILELKKQKNRDNIIDKEKKVILSLNIKFIIFFINAFIFLIIFWYYITCFCGVYINTKNHLIKDTVISFSLSLLYPFGIYLIPGIFRVNSIKAKNKEYIYKASELLQLF